MIAAILESGELERVSTGLSLLVSEAADGRPACALASYGALGVLLDDALEARALEPSAAPHVADAGRAVFARTLAATRGLKQQFRVHTVERRYVAIAHGAVRTATLRSRLVRDRGDGRRGSTENEELGRDAVTHVRVLEKLDGATLIECKLETGRTHQIRIHLSEEGHPIVGERVYSKEYRGRLIAAPRLMLHAFELGFDHPATGKHLHFEAPMPPDFRDVLESLRR